MNFQIGKSDENKFVRKVWNWQTFYLLCPNTIIFNQIFFWPRALVWWSYYESYEVCCNFFFLSLSSIDDMIWNMLLWWIFNRRTWLCLQHKNSRSSLFFNLVKFNLTICFFHIPSKNSMGKFSLSCYWCQWSSTMVSVSTVQPSINLEFLCTYLQKP